MQVTYTCVNVHPDKEKRKAVHKASGQHGVPVLVHKDRTMKSVRQIMQYLAEIKE
jgi:glutaredoxin